MTYEQCLAEFERMRNGSKLNLDPISNRAYCTGMLWMNIIFINFQLVATPILPSNGGLVLHWDIGEVVYEYNIDCCDSYMDLMHTPIGIEQFDQERFLWRIFEEIHAQKRAK